MLRKEYCFFTRITLLFMLTLMYYWYAGNFVCSWSYKPKIFPIQSNKKYCHTSVYWILNQLLKQQLRELIRAFIRQQTLLYSLNSNGLPPRQSPAFTPQMWTHHQVHFEMTGWSKASLQVRTLETWKAWKKHQMVHQFSFYSLYKIPLAKLCKLNKKN